MRANLESRPRTPRPTIWKAAKVFSYFVDSPDYRIEVIAYDDLENLSTIDLVRVRIPKFLPKVFGGDPVALYDGYERCFWEASDRDSITQGIDGPPPQDQRLCPMLHLVVGPEPTVEPLAILKPEDPGQYGIRLCLVRVESATRVPQPGETPRLGSLIGYSESPVMASIYRRSSSALSDRDFDELGYAPTDLARIERQKNRHRIVHANEDWEIEVTFEDPYSPGTWLIDVEPLDNVPSWGVKSAYSVRITRTENISVSGSQKIWAPEGTSAVPNFGSLLLLLAQRNRATNSLVHAQSHELGMSEITAAGIRTAVEFEDMRLGVQPSGVESLILDSVIASLEMSPVVGSIFEFGHLTYALATGYDMFGRKLSQAELAMMGIGAFIGVLPGVPGATGLKLLKEHTDKVLRNAFPQSPVSLISLNPGLREIAEKFFNRYAPDVAKEAIKKLDPSTPDDLIKRLKSTDPTKAQLADLVGRIGAILIPQIAKLPRIDSMPHCLALKHFSTIDPGDFHYFRDLYDRNQIPDYDALLEAFRESVKKSDPTIFQSYVTNQFGKQGWDVCSDELHRRVLGTIFDLENGGFRLAGHEDSFLREMLAQRWDKRRSYLEKAPNMGKVTLEWILTLPENSRVRMILQMELGPQYEKLLKRAVRLESYAVSPQSAAAFDQMMKGGLEKGSPSFSGPYTMMREKVVEIAGSVGRLFQCDHVLEARFFRRGFQTVWAMHSDDFQAFLVPYNGEVLRGLLAQRVSSAIYTHTQKSALTRKFIPYGKEGYFTTVEVFETYQYIYVHIFGLNFDFFVKQVGPIFSELAAARGEKAIKFEAIDSKTLGAQIKAKLELIRNEPMIE
jgi:hypothetical protein